jgi:hypothetical protein
MHVLRIFKIKIKIFKLRIKNKKNNIHISRFILGIQI